MAIIKHISIHKSPLNFLKYILREESPEDVIVTGLNCSEDAESAYKEFKMIYEYFSGKPFYRQTNLTGKTDIKLHHYIQSFKPGEITPEQAHEIGVAWAKHVFGFSRQILVSTHCEKNHIHNHFAVAVFTPSGKRWIDNKQTLKKCRDDSDILCKSYNLSVIENPSKKHNHKYGEWKARQQKCCWKDKLREDIDNLVLREDVRTINDLVSRLKEMDYTVTFKKYLTVKSPKAKHAIRTFRLGDGYALEELKYRIEYKQPFISFEKIMQYQGIARDQAMCLRQLQLILFHKNPYEFPRKTSFHEVRRNAELLTFISENKITSEDDFKRLISANSDKYDRLKQKQQRLAESVERTRKIINDTPDYLELFEQQKQRDLTKEERERLSEVIYINQYDINSLDDLSEFRKELLKDTEELDRLNEELSEAEMIKNNSVEHYNRYTQIIQFDYDILLEKARKEYSEYLKKVEEGKEMEEILKKYPYLSASYEKNNDRNYYSR